MTDVETRPRSADMILVDDHPLLAQALARHLETDDRSVEIAPLDLGDELLDRLLDRSPTLAILDLGLPIDGGGEALIQPLTEAGTKVVVLTGETDRQLWARCSAAGAEVILAKTEPMEDLRLAIERVWRGEVARPHQRPELAVVLRTAEAERARRLAPFQSLSDREQAILAALVDGLVAGQIAERDIVSVKTVRTQIKSVMRKLGVSSQIEAVAAVAAAGWTLPDR